MSTLADEYITQQERCRELLSQYKAIGPAGNFGAMMISDVLRRADKAAVEQNLPDMIKILQEMKGLE